MNRLRWSICIVVFIAGLVAISSELSPEADPTLGNASDILTSPVSIAWFSLDEKARQLLRETRAQSGPGVQLAAEFQQPVAPAPADPQSRVPQPEVQHPDADQSVVPSTAFGRANGAGSVVASWTVRPGDSMWKIARDVLGDARRMSEIISLNPGVSPERLREGQIIRLPGGGLTESSPMEQQVFLHTVEEGETLVSIARLHYGVENWTPILAANRDLLANPDHLRIGLRLKIPPRDTGRRGKDR
ncbi:MAG: LysM peptidoglycan-binding domain-containing protein [Planctomycetota bacterium]